MSLRYGRLTVVLLSLSLALSTLELFVSTTFTSGIDTRLLTGIVIYVFFLALGQVLGNAIPYFLDAKPVSADDPLWTKVASAGLPGHYLLVHASEPTAFSVQAFKAPVTVLTSELVEKLSVSALQGVLAHEAQHGTQNHLRKSGALMAFLISVKFTLGIPSILVPLTILGFLWVLRYWEYEADLAAAKTHSPAAMLAALKEVRQLQAPSFWSQLPEVFMAFPSWQKRISRIQQLVQEQNRS